MANIILTGGNQGIGYFMAEKFLQNGDCVAVLDLENDNLRELKKEYPGRLLDCICDMRDAGGVVETVNRIAASFQTIDIAIHNACRCTFDSMADTADEVYQEVFDVNYFGALRLSRAVLPYMRAQHCGRVVFTSSGVGVMGFANISPYASSKGAVEALAKCLSLEYEKEGITFHILHPPLTRTKSSAPFPFPAEYKADPRTVGYGLVENINGKGFVICHSFLQKVQTELCYLFSLRMGRLMSGKMAALSGREGNT